jgi:hypothetical protein
MLRWLSLAALCAIPLMFSPFAHAESLVCGIYLDAETVRSARSSRSCTRTHPRTINNNR